MSRWNDATDDGPGQSSRRGMLKQTAGAAVLGVTALAARPEPRILHPRSEP